MKAACLTLLAAPAGATLESSPGVAKAIAASRDFVVGLAQQSEFFA